MIKQKIKEEKEKEKTLTAFLFYFCLLPSESYTYASRTNLPVGRTPEPFPPEDKSASQPGQGASNFFVKNAAQHKKL
jgi:hypothetical protein